MRKPFGIGLRIITSPMLLLKFYPILGGDDMPLTDLLSALRLQTLLSHLQRTLFPFVDQF